MIAPTKTRRAKAAKAGDGLPKTCPWRLPSPELAGFQTWELVKEAAASFPNLRPCPKALAACGAWMWRDKVDCQRCPWAVVSETNNESASGHKKSP